MKLYRHKVLHALSTCAGEGEWTDVFDILYETSLPYSTVKETLDKFIAQGAAEQRDARTYRLTGDALPEELLSERKTAEKPDKAEKAEKPSARPNAQTGRGRRTIEERLAELERRRQALLAQAKDEDEEKEEAPSEDAKDTSEDHVYDLRRQALLAQAKDEDEEKEEAPSEGAKDASEDHAFDLRRQWAERFGDDDLFTEEELKEIEEDDEDEDDEEDFLRFANVMNTFDEKCKAALAFAITEGYATRSLFQRSICVGFTTASRILERLIRAGYISDDATNGARHRVLIGREEFLAKRDHLFDDEET